ncbi:hypothetical protein FE784_07670 [Paenibacillus hemerocallicola]|uniref:Tc1-like transposase DDE domain-containing protein n=1 Tax=Paenibacillus hemerocallicola TaxID=1172614 RepID=A0A5C4TE12_9BACL|nr:transposase [Paenibacillus hemerocallicola]TNJ66757.1 hypothetical protein FE784_07670 [Paenibacillus hemerocallicola]
MRTGKHRGIKLLVTLNYTTGHILWKEDDNYTAETFFVFLKTVVEAYPQGKSLIVLDNARIHFAKLPHPFLEHHRERLSPKTYWKDFGICLKADVVNNVFYHTIAEIRTKVTAFMQHVALDTQWIIDRLCLRLESGKLTEYFLFNLYNKKRKNILGVEKGVD